MTESGLSSFGTEPAGAPQELCPECGAPAEYGRRPNVFRCTDEPETHVFLRLPCQVPGCTWLAGSRRDGEWRCESRGKANKREARKHPHARYGRICPDCRAFGERNKVDNDGTWMCADNETHVFWIRENRDGTSTYEVCSVDEEAWKSELDLGERISHWSR